MTLKKETPLSFDYVAVPKDLKRKMADNYLFRSDPTFPPLTGLLAILTVSFRNIPVHCPAEKGSIIGLASQPFHTDR